MNLVIKDKSEHFENLLQKYKDAKIPKYEIMDSDDERTCTSCKTHRGNIYKTEDAVVGVNFPPFHDKCRCTVYPIFD